MTFCSTQSNGICPICGCLAIVFPQVVGLLAVQCDRCGEFDFSDEAAEMLDAFPGPFDRERLSDVVVDVCMMSDCERPLIDSITVSAIFSFATM